MPSFVEKQSRSPHENDSHVEENGSSFDLIGAHVNPNAPQDITFHLEIEATEDLEEDLESFSRLRRLGQFTAAMNHFRRCLLNSLDNTYVLVQYGQFLLESSDINGLSQLAEKFAAKQYNTHLAVDDEWFMILLRASILTCDPLPALLSRRDRSTVSRYLLQVSWPRLDSTEIQVLYNTQALSMSALDDFDSLSSYTQSQDKHCSLSHASTYLKVAQHYAVEVRNRNPANLKSRPYLQWVLAKFRLQQSKKPAAGHLALIEHLSKLPGDTVWRYGMFPFRDLTVYVPRADEAPDWKLESFVSEEEHEATKMVHKVATELGDIQLQAACLQLMIY
ncbi:hypothetical protein GCG54_00004903 [Colletotrichum gloeosporioides]|uniref:Uncharacterized protein n=1 Tax=Colletotrichum gloeosporioides TaxID=474922 RepID=A0A8H4CH55_COLGL|nr:uncharacterized protein GCG54_00004903 [Colletotrichum gloeosporioides]KAF3803724.1 hypothetical protein GCG54_00004903 [Colletotrichum gloeosporioides]